MHTSKHTIAVALLVVMASAASAGDKVKSGLPLQPLASTPTQLTIKGLPGKVYYVPSTLETIKWGYLPNATDAPVLTVPSGATVVFDTLSHEGQRRIYAVYRC